ncbi:MAG: hypothetical protein IJM28_03645 [Lachnospiraceae bacterium]|nr:hypothetical protein [Lachnospiraceae bacterium]
MRERRIEIACSDIQQSIFGAPSQAGCVRPVLSEGKKYFVEYRSMQPKNLTALVAQHPPQSATIDKKKTLIDKR